MKETEITIQNNITDLEIHSDSALSIAENFIKERTTEIKNLNAEILLKTQDIEEALAEQIKVGSNIDTGFTQDIKVHLCSDRINVRFIFNTHLNTSIDVELYIADKYKIFDHFGVIRTEMMNKESGDIYKIRFNGVEIESYFDADIMLMYSYLAQEFKNNGEFIQNVKKYFQELWILWDKQHELSSPLHIVNDKRDRYLLNQCVKQAISMSLLKTFNEGIVFISIKKKEFVEFKAIQITHVGNKNLNYIHSSGIVDYSYSNDAKMYYFSIKKSQTEHKTTIDEFFKDMGHNLLRGNKIEIYTLDDWKNYQMLNLTETDNLRYSESLTDGLEALHKKYERIYQL